MLQIILAIFLVLITIYIVPFIVYGVLSSLWSIKTPDGSPVLFLMSVFVSKAGTAITFVLIYYFAQAVFSSNWLLYTSLWLFMFIIGELGQAIAPNYTFKEAIAGIISEVIYFPVSGYIIYSLIK